MDSESIKSSGSFFSIEKQDIEVLCSKISSLVQNVPEHLYSDLLLEIDYFFSRLEALSPTENKKEASDHSKIKNSVFEILKADSIQFFVELLGGLSRALGFPDSEVVQKEYTNFLREFGVYNFNQVSRAKIKNQLFMKRWFIHLNQKTALTPERISAYLFLLKNRIYSFSENPPFEFQDSHRVAQKILNSTDFQLNFDEIYEAEIELRNQIYYCLLILIAPSNRVEYLISKDLVSQVSENFIHNLHSEFSDQIKELLKVEREANKKIKKGKDSMKTEFVQAAKIQSKTFGKDLPKPTERISFAMLYEPLMEIGGDFYRVEKISEDSYAIFLADIAGHGISAAMYFKTLQLSFDSSFKQYSKRPHRLMENLNSELYGKLDDYFITGMYIYINLKEKRILYSNAGHPKGFMYEITPRGTGRVKFLRQTGRVLGIYPKSEYREESFEYLINSRLVVYTDGITETFNEQKEMLGERRLLDFFKNTHQTAGNDTILLIHDHIHKFQSLNIDQDDRCLIITDLYTTTTTD